MDILVNRLIDLMGKVFINGPGDLGSIPGSVIPKTLKLYLVPLCLTSAIYGVYQG